MALSYHNIARENHDQTVADLTDTAQGIATGKRTHDAEAAETIDRSLPGPIWGTPGGGVL